jgi:EAL domain-containing protein (putative c-di-GMP-specific phosphodiesterase class I)
MDDTTFAARLRRALAQDELRLHYQPKFDVARGQLVGLEALVRWAPPPGAWVAPAHFLPVAEQEGLLGALGGWALQEACRQTTAWHLGGSAVPSVSVNVSAIELAQPDFAAQVERALARAELPAEFLELEVAAQAMSRAPAQTTRVLAELRRAGVRVSLDGFGGMTTGLAAFSRWPLDAVEIDRVLVGALDTPGEAGVRAASLVGALTRLAKERGLRVRAEGVETAMQRSCLAAAGCDDLQGDLLSPPLAPADLLALLPSHAAGVVSAAASSITSAATSASASARTPSPS